MSHYAYFLVYKPYGMLSQFSREGDAPTLADLDFSFPKDVYPVGRLDADSEGLLLLTNDNYLKTRMLDPQKGHPRTYYVQVEGVITEAACTQLSRGVTITLKGKSYRTMPATASPLLPGEARFPERDPPIRFRKHVPDSWLRITLTEGKNRQVRRMTAAVGFPTLRLVRVAIGALTLEGMQPGEVRRLDASQRNKWFLQQ